MILVYLPVYKLDISTNHCATCSRYIPKGNYCPKCEIAFAERIFRRKLTMNEKKERGLHERADELEECLI